MSAATSPTRTRSPTHSTGAPRPTTWSTRSTPPTSSPATPRRRRPSGRRPPRRASGRSSTSAVSATTATTCPPTCAAGVRSRRLLGEAGVPVTVLRAGIVIGHGGISWEITRQLVEHLPGDGRSPLGPHPHPADRHRRRRPLLGGRARPPRGDRADVRGRWARGARVRRHDEARRCHRGPDAADRARSRSSRRGCPRCGCRSSPTSTPRPGATSSTRWSTRSSSGTRPSRRSSLRADDVRRRGAGRARRATGQSVSRETLRARLDRICPSR